MDFKFNWREREKIQNRKENASQYSKQMKSCNNYVHVRFHNSKQMAKKINADDESGKKSLFKFIHPYGLAIALSEAILNTKKKKQSFEKI